MATATLSSKHQISIPKPVREAQGWREGQELTRVVPAAPPARVPVE